MSELQKMLERRQKINNGEEAPQASGSMANPSPHTAFPDFSRKQIQDFEKQFKTFNESKSGFISELEMKRLMEKSGNALTHTALKALIKEIDMDCDGQISFFEFLSIFSKATKGELSAIDGLSAFVNMVNVNVSEVGVGGAKNFFEAKANALKKEKDSAEEIKKEQQERKVAAEEAAARKKVFAERAAMFGK